MKNITIVTLTITALMFTASPTFADIQENQQPCTCLQGETITLDEQTLCAQQATQEGQCPPGSTFDTTIGLCLAPCITDITAQLTEGPSHLN